jgi:hypothetical protein
MNFRDVKAVFPPNDPEPQVFVERCKTLELAIQRYRERCSMVHDEAFELVEREKENNCLDALEDTKVYLEQFKAQILVHEVRKLFPAIVPGKVGKPELWLRHARQHRNGQVPGATNNPLIEWEKRRLLRPATSYHNNQVSSNMQAANPSPNLGTLPDVDSQTSNAEDRPIWSGWRFWVVTPAKEEPFTDM